MPIYEYETIPQESGEASRRFEIRQCMSDEPLSVHPETGEPIRRVYSAFSVGGSGKGHGGHGHRHVHSGPGCCCGGSCGCDN